MLQRSTLRPPSELLLPDVRFAVQGSVQSTSIEDLHMMVRPFELNAAVPDEVQWQFDTARNAFVYCWFCYELATLAESYSYAALENGLRARAKNEGSSLEYETLGRLLKLAGKKRWLNPAAFELSNDVLIAGRNHLHHGHPQLFHQFTLEVMNECCARLNALFP